MSSRRDGGWSGRDVAWLLLIIGTTHAVVIMLIVFMNADPASFATFATVVTFIALPATGVVILIIVASCTSPSSDNDDDEIYGTTRDYGR